MLQQRLSVITLGVADIEASRHFYTDVLGWKTDDRENCIFFDLGGYALALYEVGKLAEDISLTITPPERRGFNGFTLAYNVGSAKEVDQLFRKLAAHNVDILKPPQAVFWGGYSGYFADVDGHPWEIAFNPFVTIDAAGRMRMDKPSN
jgi:uncharacterized protein